jgi:DNA topoisomerase-3
MVVKRFLAVFYPAAEYMITTRITRVEGEPFKTEGKVLVNPGWLAIYGREAQRTRKQSGRGAARKEKVVARRFVLNATKPAAGTYSEATLLSAMEGAGKMVDDEELRAAMAGRGLGTPATRAQIIENLIGEQYLHREGRELQPTAKAFSLMTLLNGLGIPELTAPELTGEWEWKLARMERARCRAGVHEEIAAMTQHIVDRAKSYDSDTIPGDFGELKRRARSAAARSRKPTRSFSARPATSPSGRSSPAASSKPRDRRTAHRAQDRPADRLPQQDGTPFNAIIKLNADNAPEFDFGQGSGANKTRRKFSAFLVRGKDGKVGFEFEKREPKTAAKAPAKATAKKSPAATEASAEAPKAKKPAAKSSAKAAVKKATSPKKKAF